MEETTDNLMEEISGLRSIPSLIMVLGVGGAGGNAVNHMWDMGIEGVNLAVCNTDVQDLEKSPVSRKIILGDGLGAGNDAAVGEQKAKASLDQVRQCFTACGTKMLFIAAGMGAGTGTGASPVIAELASEMGILTVAIVTMPPHNDGPERTNQAREGVERLRKHVDSLIVLSNDSISRLYGNLSISGAFDKANDVVAFAAKGIAEIITRKTNIVNNDFSDVCKVMRGGGCAIMGMSSASGDDRAEEAVDGVFQTSLFGNTSIAGAKRVLLNIAVADGETLTQHEVDKVKDRIQTYASTTDDDGVLVPTNIIWGASVKPELGDKLEVIIVATGFPATEDYYKRVLEIEQQPAKAEEGIAMLGGETGGLKSVKEPSLPPINRQYRPVQNIIGKSTRTYAEVEESKRTPAFHRRNIKMLDLPAGSRKRVAQRDADGEAPAVQEQTPDNQLF